MCIMTYESSLIYKGIFNCEPAVLPEQGLCGWHLVVVGGLVRLDDLTNYAARDFHVPGRATQDGHVVSKLVT